MGPPSCPLQRRHRRRPRPITRKSGFGPGPAEPAGRGHAKPKRNGGRHCCQPPLRRAKDLPVFMIQDPKTLRHKSRLTSSGIASHRLNARRASSPMFRAPSWDDPCCVPLCSPPSRGKASSRVALHEDHLFRRLFPAGPEKPRGTFHCLPAEIGPSAARRAFLPLPALR